MEVYHEVVDRLWVEIPSTPLCQQYHHLQQELERKRQEIGWQDEPPPTVDEHSKRYRGGDHYIRLFSFYHRRIGAVATNARKITLPKGDSLVTIFFQDRFLRPYTAPPTKDGNWGYLVEANPASLMHHRVAIQRGVIRAGSDKQKW